MTLPRLQFELPEASWDERLEAVAAEPVPGRIHVAYEHRPSFLASVTVLGDECQVIMGRQGDTVAALGLRSTRRQYLDGQPSRLGYLSGLRLRPGVRSGLCLARGYAFLQQLHEQDPVPGYLTTIIASNTAARRTLESGRAGLPAYVDCGAYTTYVLAGHRTSPPAGVRPARPTDSDALFALLRATGTRRQGYPVVGPEDLGTPRLRGLRLEDFLLAERGGECVGCVAGWDQTSFRQHRVVGYAGPWGGLRPLLNPFLAVLGYPRLPAPGQSMASLHAAFLAVRDDDPQVATALLAALRDRVAREQRHHLCVGLHEGDPLTAAVRPFPAVRYAARLYAVAWDAPDRFARAFRSPHVPYLELGML